MMPYRLRDGYRSLFACLALFLSGWATSAAPGAELWIGGATTNITPDRPVALAGQRRTRIARTVESPVTATVLALESKQQDKILDQAVMVSCDLVAIRGGFVEAIGKRLKDSLPDLDATKVIFNATHTHTAPVTNEGTYDVKDKDVITPTEYVELLTDRLSDAIERAWKGRRPGSVSWGLGHAVIGENRRVVYANGTAQMYGRTNRPDFRGLEGEVDHGVEVLFFWDENQKLTATAVNVACPSQLVESRSAVNADFWHEVREGLREKHGKDLLILGWTGAAGDQTPRPMIRSAAEDRMRRLRGLTGLEEHARRIVRAWEDAYAGARQERHSDVLFVHQVSQIKLSPRKISTDEYAQAKEAIAAAANQPDNQWTLRWHQRVVDRYEQQRKGTFEALDMELHILRLGDVAIATNDFELFTNFGIQIKARSPALQTFLIQLAGPGSYVPTMRAVRGGGYSAIPQSNIIGPEGGQELVEETVKRLQELWSKPGEK